LSRVTLRTVLASLAAGDTTEEILGSFPSLKPEDVKAAIAFAAASLLTPDPALRAALRDRKAGEPKNPCTAWIARECGGSPL
jgi:hypothetical protein